MHGLLPITHQQKAPGEKHILGSRPLSRALKQDSHSSKSSAVRPRAEGDYEAIAQQQATRSEETLALRTALAERLEEARSCAATGPNAFQGCQCGAAWPAKLLWRRHIKLHTGKLNQIMALRPP